MFPSLNYIINSWCQEFRFDGFIQSISLYLLFIFMSADNESARASRRQLKDTIYAALFDMNVPAVCAINQVCCLDLSTYSSSFSMFLTCQTDIYVKANGTYQEWQGLDYHFMAKISTNRKFLLSSCMKCNFIPILIRGKIYSVTCFVGNC